MTAVEGGSVVCFVVHVLETPQYLNRGQDITPLLFLPEWVVSGRENFSQSPLDYAWCVWQNQGIGSCKCGAPPNSQGVWARLNGQSHSFRRVPNSEVWVGQPRPIYRDGTWR